MILVCNNRQGAVSVLITCRQSKQTNWRLYHSGQFDRQALMASPRWQQANKALTALGERWDAHKAYWDKLYVAR